MHLCWAPRSQSPLPFWYVLLDSGAEKEESELKDLLVCRSSRQLWAFLPALTQPIVLQLIFIQICLFHLLGQVPGPALDTKSTLLVTFPVQPTVLTLSAKTLMLSPASHLVLVCPVHLLAQEFPVPAYTGGGGWRSACCHSCILLAEHQKMRFYQSNGNMKYTEFAVALMAKYTCQVLLFQMVHVYIFFLCGRCTLTWPHERRQMASQKFSAGSQGYSRRLCEFRIMSAIKVNTSGPLTHSK